MHVPWHFIVGMSLPPFDFSLDEGGLGLLQDSYDANSVSGDAFGIFDDDKSLQLNGSNTVAESRVLDLERQVTDLRRRLACHVVDVTSDRERSRATLVVQDAEAHGEPDGLVVAYCGLCLAPHTSFSAVRACVYGHVRPVRCYSGGCRERFATTAEAQGHFERAHRELPQLFCIKCAQGFGSALELKAHERRHAADAQYRYVLFRCNVCGDISVPPDKFVEHVETQHGTIRAGSVVFPEHVPVHVLDSKLQAIYHQQQETKAPTAREPPPPENPKEIDTLKTRESQPPEPSEERKIPTSTSTSTTPVRCAAKPKSTVYLCTACLATPKNEAAVLLHPIECARLGVFNFMDRTHRVVEFADTATCKAAHKALDGVTTAELRVTVLGKAKIVRDFTVELFGVPLGNPAT